MVSPLGLGFSRQFTTVLGSFCGLVAPRARMARNHRARLATRARVLSWRLARVGRRAPGRWVERRHLSAREPLRLRQVSAGLVRLPWPAGGPFAELPRRAGAGRRSVRVDRRADHARTPGPVPLTARMSERPRDLPLARSLVRLADGRRADAEVHPSDRLRRPRVFLPTLSRLHSEQAWWMIGLYVVVQAPSLSE